MNLLKGKERHCDGSVLGAESGQNPKWETSSLLSGDWVSSLTSCDRTELQSTSRASEIHWQTLLEERGCSTSISCVHEYITRHESTSFFFEKGSFVDLRQLHQDDTII